MNYNIPAHIQVICAKQNLKDPAEQETLKKEIVKYLTDYLDLKKGKNSLANVTDTVKDTFKVVGTNYPFERDIAGRMMRTRDFTMQEGVAKNGKEEVYVIAADRDWWDKNHFWFSTVMLILGAVVSKIPDILDSLLHIP